jgi:hypothetical protein
MSADPTIRTPAAPAKPKGLFRRGPWEMAMTGLITVGILMLVQPFAMSLFTYSFITILIGTLGFVVVSHFPE